VELHCALVRVAFGGRELLERRRRDDNRGPTENVGRESKCTAKLAEGVAMRMACSVGVALDHNQAHGVALVLRMSKVVGEPILNVLKACDRVRVVSGARLDGISP